MKKIQKGLLKRNMSAKLSSWKIGGSWDSNGQQENTYYPLHIWFNDDKESISILINKNFTDPPKSLILDTVRAICLESDREYWTSSMKKYLSLFEGYDN